MGLSDLGGAVTWGEAKDLIYAAAEDPSTAFGAELAGWAYPASIPDLLSIAAQIGDWKAARKVMPWAMARPGHTTATEEEIAAAEAALEAGIIFSS